MTELLALAKTAGTAQAALVDLQNRLGGNLRRRNALRKRILAMATDEERRIYHYAESLPPEIGSGAFNVLLAIAARHA